MPLISVEQAIEDIRTGKFVIVVDDEDRENEGDFVIAAEWVTPEAINLMATHGRGGLGRMVMGSVADRVVRHSSAPVLLIRPRP